MMKGKKSSDEQIQSINLLRPSEESPTMLRDFKEVRSKNQNASIYLKIIQNII